MGTLATRLQDVSFVCEIVGLHIRRTSSFPSLTQLFATPFFLHYHTRDKAVGYPFDLIKTRIQAINAVSSTASVEPVNLSIWAMARQIMSEGGAIVSSAATTGSTATAATTAVFPNVFALYRGFGWKLVRAIPASMIGFTTYEFVVAQLHTISKN